MVGGFLDAFLALALAQPERSAIEVGCGEGELCQRLLRAGFAVRGFDIADAAVDEAHRRAAAAGLAISYARADVDELAKRGTRAPLLVCCEVLEHIPDPERALDQLIGMANPWLLVSVPREPLWRILNLCRGRYLRDLGNTPGHVNHWSAGAFLRLLRARTTVVATRYPLPWTMALCRVR
ncbi:MAG: methyltransferase domain-containing protein [Rhodanobacteraceae bacterium]|nr:methyltransferase domain-containing protein [Rhodanobacteraceae bacterium]